MTDEHFEFIATKMQGLIRQVLNEEGFPEETRATICLFDAPVDMMPEEANEPVHPDGLRYLSYNRNRLEMYSVDIEETK